jgi:Tfp pilus assembly protein PilO
MIIKMLLFPVALLAVLYLVIAQLVPAFKDQAKFKEDIKAEQSNLQTAQMELERISSFEQEVQSKTEEKKFMAHFVPNGKKEEILLNDIPQLAAAGNVSLFAVSFSAGERKDKNSEVESVEGQMIITGTYGSIKDFMHKMYRIGRLYDFKSLSLTKMEQKTKDGEEIAEGEPTLSGVVAFTYKYIPGKATASADIANAEINFELIDTIMNSMSKTNDLKTEKQYRANPFLP